MNEESTPPEVPVSALSPSADREDPERLAARLSRLEVQVRTLGDRVAELGAGERTRKQRALVLRLALLAVLLGLFFVVKARS